MAKKRSARVAHARPNHGQNPNPGAPTTGVQLPDIPTVIEFVIDETGSMGSYIGGTINGFNTFLDEQKSQPGACRLTLTKFSTSSVVTPYEDLDLSMIVPLTNTTFVPAGGTNLYDTIGARIEAVQQRTASWTVQPRILFVVLTDGEDNANLYYKPDRLRQMISERTQNGWTFAYLGAHQRALSVAQLLGFPAANSKQFSGERMYETMTDLSAATTAYRTGAADAKTANNNFFS